MAVPDRLLEVNDNLRPTLIQAPAPAHSTPINHLKQKLIAELAYGYWEARGHPWGSPDEDWFRAEQEIRKRQHRW